MKSGPKKKGLKVCALTNQLWLYELQEYRRSVRDVAGIYVFETKTNNGAARTRTKYTIVKKLHRGEHARGRMMFETKPHELIALIDFVSPSHSTQSVDGQ